MKTRYLIIVILITICIIIIGIGAITKQRQTDSLSKVTSYEATKTGILFQFDDGTGYYLEKK